MAHKMGLVLKGYHCWMDNGICNLELPEMEGRFETTFLALKNGAWKTIKRSSPLGMAFFCSDANRF